MIQDACDAPVTCHGLAPGFRGSKRPPIADAERTAAGSRGYVDAPAAGYRAAPTEYAQQDKIFRESRNAAARIAVSNLGRVPRGRRGSKYRGCVGCRPRLIAAAINVGRHQAGTSSKSRRGAARFDPKAARTTPSPPYPRCFCRFCRKLSATDHFSSAGILNQRRLGHTWEQRATADAGCPQHEFC